MPSLRVRNLDRSYYPESIYTMPKQRHTVDQIIANLLEADVELGEGKMVPGTCKLLEIVGRSHRTDLVIRAGYDLWERPRS